MNTAVTGHPVRIPADVEREDRVLAGLTARQLAILAVTGLVLYGLYAATRPLLPAAGFVALAAPIAAAAAVVALGSRDGLSLDRLLLAALRQRLSPRVQVAAPGGIQPAPSWLTAHATKSRMDSTTNSGGPTPRVLDLPARGVADAATAGAIDLGPDGVAAVCVCSTVNFALRTPGEQEALVASFGRYLHSLTAPVQILIRAQRLDLSAQIEDLREHAGGLPHQALDQAALEHADYLAQLADQSDLLRRQVLLVLREPLHAASVTRPMILAGLPGVRRSGRADARAAQAARPAAETRLARRVGEAVALLSAAGIVATPLDVAQASSVLAGACNPDRLIAPTAALAAPDEVITVDDDDDHLDRWPVTAYSDETALRHPAVAADDEPDTRTDAPIDFAGHSPDNVQHCADDRACKRWWAR